MYQNWKKVYASKNQIEAEIVRSILEERQLLPVLMNKTDSSYGSSIDGEFEIYVNAEVLLKALNIIANEIQFE